MLIRWPADLLQIFSFEFLFCAVQQHPQVFAIYAKLPANLIPVPLIKKDGLEQRTISHRQIEKNLADFDFQLPRGSQAVRVCANSRQASRVCFIERLISRGSPIMLKKHVVTDGIDKSAEALWLAERAWLFQASQDPGKGFLAYIFDGLRGSEPGAKLQMEQRREITNKMLLSARIPGTQIFDVICIECMKFQSGPR